MDRIAMRSAPGIRPLRRALVVDNEEFMQRMLQRLLGKRCAEIDLTGTAEQAMSLVTRHGPLHWDLMVVDLHLEDSDGATLCRWMREHGVPAATPILLCTGSIHPTLETEMGRQGVTAVLRKPFDIQEFYTLLDDLLARRPVP